MEEMGKRDRRARNQFNVRLTDEDLEYLERCQKLLGGLSQADTLRILTRMFLGKVPSFPERKRSKK